MKQVKNRGQWRAANIVCLIGVVAFCVLIWLTIPLFWATIAFWVAAFGLFWMLALMPWGGYWLKGVVIALMIAIGILLICWI